MKKVIYRGSILVTMLFLLFMCLSFKVYGRETAAIEEKIEEQQREHNIQETKLEEDNWMLWDKVENQELDLEIRKLLPEEKQSFSELVKEIMMGDKKLNINLIKEKMKEGVFGNIDEMKKMIGSILLLGIMSALFSNFGYMFKNHQIVDISFYFIYMLFTLLLLVSFRTAMDVAVSMLENAILFMKLLIPTFFTVIGFTSATMTAVVFNQFMFVIITLVESILVAILIPATSVYIFLSLVNGLGEEERFASIIELLHKGIEGSLKIMIAAIGGMGFFQSMITPVIDSVKTATVQKAISAIPGVGKVADSISEVVLGSTILIKNSVGIAFVILLLSMCAVPLIQIFMLAAIMKISAALIGIVTDKRMTNCANQVGDGTFLILRIAMTAVALVIIIFAIILSTTNHGI